MKPIHHILRTCVFTAASLCIQFPAAAQTTLLDLKSQAKGVDFSKASSTKPFRTGTVLPQVCTVGETFFKTDAAAGLNLYSCTSTNVWTVEGGGGLPNFAGNADRLLGTNGSLASWVALGGDVTGAPQTLQVSGLRGNRVASTTPTDGQVLRWNSTALNWEPGTVTASGGGGSTTTGGDLYGPVGNATVTRMQNKPLSAAIPADGQVLTWSQAAGQWQPQSAAGGTGGAGSGGSPAILSVLGVTYSSANTLTIGGGCSLANPCNVRFGNNVISVTASSTVTWQSGTGNVYFYVTSAGTVAVGSNLTLTCSSGCLSLSGISSFPANTIPLYTWSAVPTGWDSAGGKDARAYLSSKLISPGTGTFIVESGQQTTIGVDTTLIPTYTTGTASLSFGTLAGASCSADLTVSVPGALTGDAVAPGWPAALPAPLMGTMRVTAANVVSVRVCNVSAAAVTVPALSYRGTVVRGL